jgi:hypothetical protein
VKLAKGMVWGTLLSLPIWLSFFGWIKMADDHRGIPLVHEVHHILTSV